MGVLLIKQVETRWDLRMAEQLRQREVTDINGINQNTNVKQTVLNDVNTISVAPEVWFDLAKRWGKWKSNKKLISSIKVWSTARNNQM